MTMFVIPIIGSRVVKVDGKRVISQNVVGPTAMLGQRFEHEAETEAWAKKFARYSKTFGPITPEVEAKYHVKKA